LPADAFWPLEGALSIPPVPIAGDAVLPEPMLRTFLTAKQHRLPLMAGSNSDEASVLDYFGVDATAVLQQLRAKNRLLYRSLKWLYDIHDDRLLGRAVARDMAFSLVPWLVMRAQHQAGMPGWRYWFDYVSEHARDLYLHGTWHGNEVPYALNTLSQIPEPSDGRPFSEADRAFAERVSEYWFNFARDATEYKHQLAGEVTWPAWHPGDDVTMSLGEGGQNSISLRKNFMRARMRLFRLLMSRMVKL
ncbi:carboxylesterase family protein, partial [Pantoea deleyi]